MTDVRPYNRVAVYKGGISSEREVSLRSGAAVAKGLRQAGYFVEEVDVTDETPAISDGIEAVFVALHGVYGEDGGVQSYLREKGVPYTGSPPESSLTAFDKRMSKIAMLNNSLPTAPFEVLHAGDERSLELPVVVKPTREGSSIGISRVFSEKDWQDAFEEALQYGDEVLVEQFVDGRECTVGIVGNEALPIVEIIPRDSYYSYAAKYADSGTRYSVPAQLPSELAKSCQSCALEIFRLLGCRGCARVDFLVDGDLNPYILELNSIPGFTETSLLPKAARSAGIQFPQLCDRIMRLAAH